MSTNHRKTSLCDHLSRWLKRKSRKLSSQWLDAVLVLLHLSLEPAREILSPLYSPIPEDDRLMTRYACSVRCY
jgi:hypothetical protein